jgi:hypothetical protein
METRVHVFVGGFAGPEEACAYTEAQWEAEPGDEVSDEEYAAWEDRNPVWPLRYDLGCYLDSDFLETIVSDDRYTYLGNMLLDKSDLERIVQVADDRDNSLVLVFQQALGEFDCKMKSTSCLKYCGEYARRLT